MKITRKQEIAVVATLAVVSSASIFYLSRKLHTTSYWLGIAGQVIKDLAPDVDTAKLLAEKSAAIAVGAVEIVKTVK